MNAPLVARADPIAEGLARGWKVVDAATLREPQRIDCDVALVGTGAGGGISAELLAKAGLAVVLIEEGPLASSRDFRMREADAYPQLYWDSAARKTKDKAINILQGRAVGGSTTVNWTSSFRTPPATLAFWRSRFGLSDYSEAALAPWFAQSEARLAIRPWTIAPNENNSLLARGAAALGISTAGIRRNVAGCANLGYCGVGCPINAKQSMLVTTIPAALERGARLYTRLRALRFEFDGARIARLVCAALRPDGLVESGVTVVVRARHFVAAGGAINTPGLLLRSAAPDPYGLLGRRTFLHPTVISSALFEQRVDGFAGAPQSLYSDHFLEVDPIDGRLGFKLEAPPLHPVLFASTLHGFGTAHAQLMQQFAHAHALIALLRDGFHSESRGGEVVLASDGRAILDYPLNEPVWDGVRRAFLAMAEIQFAAGAKTVHPVHELAGGYTRFAEAKEAIERLPLKPLLTRVVSAHVMGGCGMAANERAGVVDGRGRHFQIENLSVHDGSVFPTSLGANPQLSIYGIVARMAGALAADLTGRPAPTLA
ncbi:MAG: putative GMC-type oxidoreductase [Betaproteobacteria bacterium]